MIYSLKGKITRVDENIIAVENNGVEYEVCCSLNAIDALTRTAGEQKVYTYLQVREDGMYLFGFADLAEKRMFLNLISVSGIGPKMAVSILSGMGLRSLASAVINQNVSLLTKIKGLGKKTAERIVLELREKVEENVKAEQSPIDGFINFAPETTFTSEMNDAVAILVELGIKKDEATKLVKAKATETDKADQIIRKCL